MAIAPDDSLCSTLIVILREADLAAVIRHTPVNAGPRDLLPTGARSPDRVSRDVIGNAASARGSLLQEPAAEAPTSWKTGGAGDGEVDGAQAIDEAAGDYPPAQDGTWPAIHPLHDRGPDSRAGVCARAV